MIRLLFRHFKRHWQLNALHFLGFGLCAGILASLPQLSVTIAGNSLAQFIADITVPNRNLLITGNAVTDTVPPEIELGLGDLFQEAITVRETKYPASSVIFHPDGTAEEIYPVTIVMDLWSFDQPEKRFSLVGGRLPSNSVTIANLEDLNIPVFEAVIGEDAAASSKLVIGDYLASSNYQFFVRVVGIVSPNDPNSEIWWGDNRLTPFNMWRRVYTSPDIDEMNISMILHPETMSSKLSRAVEWRVILDHQKINTTNIEFISTNIKELQGRLKGLNLTLKTDLLDHLERFKEKLAGAYATLFLLSVQTFLAVIYILNLASGYVREQVQDEISILAGRGFNRIELTGLLTISSGLLAITAWLLAVFMVNLIFNLWNMIQGIPFSASLPASSLWLAMAGITFSWILQLVTIYRSTSRKATLWQEEGRVLEYQYKQMNYVWDFMLLIFGALTYWQFSQAGSLSNITNSISQKLSFGTSDPVLLLGPTLLVLAAGLVLLRLFPFTLRIIARIFQRIRGLLLPLGFTKMARQPIESTRAILLISMTAGLTFFATVFNNSINTWHENMATYTAGTDFRIEYLTDEPEFINKIKELPEVAASAQVYRGEFNYQFDEFQEFSIDLLAVEPESFSRVVSYPNGLSPFTMQEVMKVLEPETMDAIPVVVSDNRMHRHLGLHDQLIYEFGLEEVVFDVSGIIVEFPLLKQPFAVANLAVLRESVDLNSSLIINRGEWELWLKAKPGQHNNVYEGILEIAKEFSLEENIIKGNSSKQFESFRADLVSQEATAAFQLNSILLIPLSVIGFLMIQIFSAWKRKPESTILQKLGFSIAQFRQMMVLEWSLVVFFGLGIGIFIGYGLTTLMEPYHATLLATTIGTSSNNPLSIPWNAVGFRFLILLILYGLTVFLSKAYYQRLERNYGN
ncbi:MAG: hypothetical protein JSV61_13260 [Anaerolineales bacterium]|nr:MAG: hypothetical protein JSV61_13260 [Anaerolineales bacterium]